MFTFEFQIPPPPRTRFSLLYLDVDSNDDDNSFSTFRFGHVFLADSGSSVGEIMGHSKSINSCDYKPSRPYKIVTAGEDQHTTFLEGPPFKFTKMLRVCILLILCFFSQTFLNMYHVNMNLQYFFVLFISNL